MVRPDADNATHSEPADNDEPPVRHRVPSLPKGLDSVYRGLSKLGATSPASGKDVRFLAKQLHEPRKQMEHELHVLEGKGVVGHQTSGHDTVWYLRK